MDREATDCSITSQTVNNEAYSTSSWLLKLQNWLATWKPRKTTPGQPPTYCQSIAETETKLLELFVKQPWERRFVELPSGEFINTVILGDANKPCLVLTPGEKSSI